MLTLPRSSKGYILPQRHLVTLQPQRRSRRKGGCPCSAQFSLCRYLGSQHYSTEWGFPSRASLLTYQPLPANPQVILRPTMINCPEILMWLGSMHFRLWRPLCPACGCTNHWHYCNYHPCWTFICPQSCTQRFWPLFLLPCCGNLAQNCTDW